MRSSIMQPHYFPWIGYFNLISNSDNFIFFDDAQFVKSSWHNRNKIIVNREEYLLILPLKKAKLSTNINQKYIDDQKKWKDKQIKTILEAYCNCEFVDDLYELTSFFKELTKENLSEFNIDIIKFISKKLNIRSKFYLSSDFGITKKRTGKIIKILDELNTSEYISPVGAKDYLDNDNFEKISKIKIIYNNYKSQKYKQKNTKDFIKNLSIIDAIANLGWKKLEDHLNDFKI